MSWASGFVQGLAGSVDKALQDDMRRTQDFIEKQTDIHSRRRMVAEERRRKEMEEIEDDLGRLSSLWAGDPNALDKAASAYQALGSNSKAVDSIYDTVMKAKLSDENFSVDNLFDISYENTKGYGMADYIETFVSAPQTFDVNLPDTYKGGLYSTLFKPDIAGQIKAGAETAVPAMEQTGRALAEGELTPAQIRYGVLPQVAEAEMQRETAETTQALAEQRFAAGERQVEIDKATLELRNLQIQQTEQEIANRGSLSYDFMEDMHKEALEAAIDAGEFRAEDGRLLLNTDKERENYSYAQTEAFSSAINLFENRAVTSTDVDNIKDYFTTVLNQTYTNGDAVINFGYRVTEDGQIVDSDSNEVIPRVTKNTPTGDMIQGQAYVGLLPNNSYIVYFRIGDQIIKSRQYKFQQ